ncbi:CPBP family intramembrane glutamic endopeptidase [Salirhabdus salicampi]|uniref:CPBP family intramembrane glutamic endopeptidase n=1 Tax=Salirhabdus salicampi TaxID=476102 RepID=UPI0020C4488C|nr:CPBP family intramembrane glutamic endopeptidase [Salirhabdus salicampi]MCP8616729.1 CPBP family intramembrane metalloprotease [Salirhabdus salicampi]
MKKRKSQAEIVASLTDEELVRQLYYSQFIFIFIAFISSLFLFPSLQKWLELFSMNGKDIVLYGLVPGVLIVFMNVLSIRILPAEYFDDGGINERIFRNRNIQEIFLIALVVSLSEEILFRGVIHTVFGFVVGSVAFALAHIRYLRKPVLIGSVLVVSFLLGYTYELTGNLAVTMTTHFTIDFLLALYIRFKRGDEVDV